MHDSSSAFNYTSRALFLCKRSGLHGVEWRRDVPFAKWSRILDQKRGERKRKREEKGGPGKGLYRNV